MPTIEIRFTSVLDKILKRGAWRPARQAAHQVRDRYQFENGQADRPDYSAECAGAGRQTDSMKTGKRQDTKHE